MLWSVCPSVGRSLVLSLNSCTYRQTLSTISSHRRYHCINQQTALENSNGSTLIGALNTDGVQKMNFSTIIATYPGNGLQWVL